MLQTVTTLKTLAPFTVLICDDHDDNIRQISALSQLLGCHVTTAINGQEAVEYCQNQKFDAILMDLVMPGISGLEAARAIHSAERPNKTTPIIAVTADEDPIVKAGCSSFGIDYYMTKPIEESTLHRILCECQAKLWTKTIGVVEMSAIIPPRLIVESEKRHEVGIDPAA